jgi:hypothetical protein
MLGVMSFIEAYWTIFGLSQSCAVTSNSLNGQGMNAGVFAVCGSSTEESQKCQSSRVAVSLRLCDFETFVIALTPAPSFRP